MLIVNESQLAMEFFAPIGSLDLQLARCTARLQGRSATFTHLSNEKVNGSKDSNFPFGPLDQNVLILILLRARIGLQ